MSFLQLKSLKWKPPTTPAGGGDGILKEYTGATWVQKPLKRYNGATFDAKPLKRWNGVSWVLVDTTP